MQGSIGETDRGIETRKDKKREREREIKSDSPQTASPHFLLVEVIKIPFLDPSLCANSSLLAPHIASETKKEKHNLHTHARIKMVMQHWFSVNRSEHTEKERQGKGSMARGREKELESKGLKPGWYSWGFTREAGGAEWTSPRNFNGDGRTRCCQCQSSSQYVKDPTD